MIPPLSDRLHRAACVAIAICVIVAAAADVFFLFRFARLTGGAVESGQLIHTVWLLIVGLAIALVSLLTPRLVMLTAPAVFAFSLLSISVGWIQTSQRYLNLSPEETSFPTDYPSTFGRFAPLSLLLWTLGIIVTIWCASLCWRQDSGADLDR